MARDDDSFWLDIFRKAPVIASCMAICGLIGAGLGFYFFGELVTGRVRLARQFACAVISCTAGGIFVGLIIGVIVDSIVNIFRDKDKKDKRPQRRF